MTRALSYSHTEAGIRRKALERHQAALAAQRETSRLEDDRKQRALRIKAAVASFRIIEVDLRPHKPRKTYRPTYARIEARACKLFGLTRVQLHARGREVRIVQARQFVMYWTVRLTTLSKPEIGRRMDRDHTTILHGIRAHQERRAAMGRRLRNAR
ncbi:helix-turn-helix domain-containing protein [Limoniibacter endophyticus]|uniref:Chromosomal replication initiator DnaA C-terminal domain-containing protein n=1 Tax=Limoniibacter endophyticus TaxID=1565040 RepID=A0A8J3DSD7_9HYPH|nr:helix-turn-helix domain-containing protein [Limoniibacter endophyticus]GHC79497.1 hypothetical protein GCM10010136_32090 [Limoniibacter endophyticus]